MSQGIASESCQATGLHLSCIDFIEVIVNVVDSVLDLHWVSTHRQELFFFSTYHIICPQIIIFFGGWGVLHPTNPYFYLSSFVLIFFAVCNFRVRSFPYYSSLFSSFTLPPPQPHHPGPLLCPLLHRSPTTQPSSPPQHHHLALLPTTAPPSSPPPHHSTPTQPSSPPQHHHPALRAVSLRDNSLKVPAAGNHERCQP